MLTNAQMKPNRFLKLQSGKRRLAFIRDNLDAGRIVYISTYTRATKLTAKHKEMVKMDRTGSLWLGRNCIDFTKITAA